MSTGQPRRSLPVTLLGILLIAGGGLLSIISFFSLLMIIAGSYGTANTTLQGFLLIVVAPPFTAITGLGLIFRWRWALLSLVGGLVIALAWSTMVIARFALEGKAGPDLSHAAWMAPVGALLLAYALTRRIRAEFGWMPVAAEAGVSAPLQPVQAAPAPEYVPHGASKGVSAAREIDPERACPTTASQYAVLGLFVVILFAIAVAAIWLMIGGIATGGIRLPVGRGIQTITALQAEKPVMYWFGISLHAVVALFCAGLALWMLRHGLFPAKGGKGGGSR